MISAAYVGEQIAINPSFGGSLGAHTSIGTLPLVYFGTAEQKARYLPRLGQRRADRRLRAHRAAVGLRRAGGADHGAPHAGRHALRPERAEDVDHQRRLRRPVHDLRQGRRREVHRLPRRTRHGRGERPRRTEARPRRLVDDGADAGQRERAGRERPRHDRRRAQGRVQHPEPRPGQARHAQHVPASGWRSTSRSPTRGNGGSSARRSPSSG